MRSSGGIKAADAPSNLHGLPRLFVADDLTSGRLITWGEASNHATELWPLQPSNRLTSTKVKAVLKFLEAAFPDK